MKYDIYRKILKMVSELHARGYQRLRIAPGMSPSGGHWRCAITPATNISSTHGALIVSWNTLAAHYTSGQGKKYFEWNDAARSTPSRLADMFIERFSEIAHAGRGSDWIYAGWYLEMLNLTHPDSLPIAYADWDLPQRSLGTAGGKSDISIPLPPPGLGTDSSSTQENLFLS